MLIACLTLGDTNVVLHRVEPLAREDREDLIASHTLSFHDLPTGQKEDLVFSTEAEAVNCFAAWIAADEGDLGDLTKFRETLYERIKTPRMFLP